jgi:sugar phosphate isomerase/epimerase
MRCSTASSANSRRAGLAAAIALALTIAAPTPGVAQRLDGFNVIAVPGHPFGGASAKHSLANAKRVGAKAVAIIPFLWQSNASSPRIERGADMPDEMLRAGIRDARALGLSVMVKPHVWVPESWAGAVDPVTEDGWREWFANYRRALERIARIAAEEKSDSLAIGTELSKTTQRPEWTELIKAVRAIYPGTLLYIAHNIEEADSVPFWGELDAVGVSLYPRLGADGDRTERLAVMRGIAERLDALAARVGKPIVVGEIGLRSAQGATAKPWESAEERQARADLLLQADVLADWLAVLDRPAIRGVLVWRWLTDPDGGGRSDTDFTVQGKPAEGVLLCAWTAKCGPH